jgi:hypothetical protein
MIALGHIGDPLTDRSDDSAALVPSANRQDRRASIAGGGMVVRMA